MCGIAGLIGPFESDKLNTVIKAMTEKMVHRGPDAEGYYIKPGVAFGHRRLAIIDLSTNANQPFSDPSGRYTLVFNGEIYNYLEIRSQIPEYNFKSNSDTEVILAAFIKWGAKSLDLLNGMFAFAIWDDKNRELFVCRDRLGIKPLYYYFQDNIFIFSSEIRSLLSAGIIKKRIDDDSLTDYLMNQAVTAPYTLFKDIYQLMPGKYGVLKNNNFEIETYWKLDSKGDFTDIDNPEVAKKETLRLLSEAVERRMISDVELGAFLSGGVDSTAVVALMSLVSEKPVNTFSVVFDESDFDESYFSKLVAKKFGTKHHPITLHANDFLSELPCALNSMDSLSADGFNTFIVSKAVRKAGFTVALSGVGGDELFAGYSHFKLFYNLKNNFWINSSPRLLKELTGSIANLLLRGSKIDRFVAMTRTENNDIENLYPLLKQVYSAKAVAQLMKVQNGFSNRIETMLTERNTEIKKFPVLSQCSIADLLGYTQNVLIKDMDQMGMANSLEIREPFFDYNLVEYVLHIPDKIKYQTSPKELLVQSLAQLMPTEISQRKKMGFTLPWDHWLRMELREFVGVNLESLGKRSQFSESEINRLWNKFLSGSSEINWIHIWQLVVLEVYLTNMGL